MNLQTLTLSTLKPAPYNPRKISDDAMSRLEKSVKEWGIVDPLIVNKATGYTIIGGHQRFKVLQKQGAQTADCVVLDLPPAKEKALNVALNNQKMAGEYEFSTLADILQEIDTGEFSVPELTGFSEEDLESIATWATSPDHKPDDPNTEWEGMPEFKQEDQTSIKSIIVHFSSLGGIEEFSKRIEQTITPPGKERQAQSIWFPPAEIGRIDKEYKDES
jgi:ParB-like chromosome segregation protein Spo0J